MYAWLNRTLKEESPQSSFEELLLENVSLAPMTTLGIGGPARYFAQVTSALQLAQAIDWTHARRLPLFVLGGGSNIVVADRGFPGLVVRIEIRGIQTRIDGDRVILRAGAGDEWDSLVAMCVERGWAGVECLSGIPGRVGATPIQNVGAYGQDVSETLLKVEAFDLGTNALCDIDAGACEFGYRTSRFKTTDKGRFIITGATFLLAPGGTPAVRYPELERGLAGHGITQPTLHEVRSAVLSLRRKKAMVIDPSDADSRSVGSFFVNPSVTNAGLQEVRSRAATLRADLEKMPAFPQPDGGVKLSAAWLIELAGIRRGFVHGGVGTSTKHALAIVNRGSGTAREVAELKELIQARVRDAFGIELVPEPVFVGFE